jgi:hypothetical protein
VDDVALFTKRYHKGLKKQGYKVVKRKFSTRRGHATIVGAPSISLPSAHIRSRTTSTRKRGRRTRPTIRRARKIWERHTLGMSRTQPLKGQVKKMRKLQPLLSTSHLLHQASSPTYPMMTTTPLTFVLWKRVRR